ncbi:recombination regulator RecX [Lactobacillus paragasseri]|uniref:RecX family transcriptional regulator n=1 Tax=Lactobacillus paragasseri TaxID=2107999 RepID=UPI000DBC179E|nr:RecX family transcriptional regulator [Lactobacillus paragasseri]GBA90131.1 regulatory protein RecX [Lactobacillus paragasseri]
MPIITKISTQKRKGRYNIFIDNEYAFSVSERTLAEKRLLKGTELSTEDIKEIKKAESDSHAIQLAMSYLSYQPRSVYEILEYLNKHEISQDASQAAVQNLIKLNYLNDNNFARLFIKNNLRVGKDGPRAVDRKLKQKGLAADVIQEALYEIEDEEWIDAGLRLVHSLIHQVGKAWRRYRRDEDFKRKQKVKRYLFQHGFSSSEIDSFLNGEVVDLEEIDEY